MLVNPARLARVLDVALAHGADFAEIYIEDTHTTNSTFYSKRPQKAVSGHLSGAGIRLMKGLEQIYTYTNDLSEEGLIRSARAAAAALKAGQPLLSTTHITEAATKGAPLQAQLSLEQKFALATQLDQQARLASSYITQVEVNMEDKLKSVQVVNSEGLGRYETRHYHNMAISTVAEHEGQKESGFSRTGALGGTEHLMRANTQDLAQTAAKMAEINLFADFAPAGEMPVVLASGFGGVIFHEACGHGLETTCVAKNASVFAGKLEQKVANECVTAIDDGTIAGHYGSLEMDDEGEATRKTVLIENGILKSYMVDRMGARHTGYQITGSGRRQDYRFAPTSRMRNTYIAAGDSSLEEMIRDVDYGLYAKQLGGGSVMPGTGAYNFGVREAYIIRNGKIDKPVKGVTLIGTGIETLGRITKVGGDLSFAHGVCGSQSGAIPVTCGQPSMLVSKLTVGGRA